MTTVDPIPEITTIARFDSEATNTFHDRPPEQVTVEAAITPESGNRIFVQNNGVDWLFLTLEQAADLAVNLIQGVCALTTPEVTPNSGDVITTDHELRVKPDFLARDFKGERVEWSTALYFDTAEIPELVRLLAQAGVRA